MIEIIPRFNARTFTEHFKRYNNALSYEHLGLSFILEKESKYEGQIQSSLFMNLMSNKINVCEVQYAYIVSCTLGQLAEMIRRTRFEHDAIYDMLSEIKKYGTYNCQPFLNLDILEERNIVEYEYNMELYPSINNSRYFNIVDCNIAFIDKADSIKDISEEARLKSSFVTFEYIDWDNIINELNTQSSVITFDDYITNTTSIDTYGLSKDDIQEVSVSNNIDMDTKARVINLKASSYELRKLVDKICELPDIQPTLNSVKKYVITDTLYNIINNASKNQSIIELKEILLEEYIGVTKDDSDNSIAYYKENFDFNRAINKDDEEEFNPDFTGSID